VEEIQKKASGPLWFRGCGRISAELVPTLYRQRRKVDSLNFADLEQELIARFRDRSIPYRDRDLGEQWEALFFMQHYGVPTRLLDWTESPFVGLYFALMSAKPRVTTGSGRVYDKNAVVWVLNPKQWNGHALKHLSYNGGALTPQHEAVKPYKSLAEASVENTPPVAMFGAHNSSRIVVQRGAFVVFGTSADPMESLHGSDGFPKDSLIKIIVPRGSILRMRKSILNHGFSEGALFPDLEGLTREFRRTYGFEF
jgi:hypothetical protein